MPSYDDNEPAGASAPQKLQQSVEAPSAPVFEAPVEDVEPQLDQNGHGDEYPEDNYDDDDDIEIITGFSIPQHSASLAKPRTPA